MNTCSKIWCNALASSNFKVDLKNKTLLDQLLWDELKGKKNAEISESDYQVINSVFIEFSEQCADEYYDGKLINDEFLDFMLVQKSGHFMEHLEFLNDISLSLTRYNRKKIKYWLVSHQNKLRRSKENRKIKLQRSEVLEFSNDPEKYKVSRRWIYIVIAVTLLGILGLLLFYFK
jgi:hypothetical protein